MFERPQTTLALQHIVLFPELFEFGARLRQFRDKLLQSRFFQSCAAIGAKFGRDPALGSSVLITACTDSGGFFIFLGLASVFLMR